MNFLILIRPENSVGSNELYIQAITKFNEKVVLVDDSMCWNDVLEVLKDIDGILLTGGDDVGKLDYLLIDYALRNDIKMLGICQGMQSMAMYGSNDSLVLISDDYHYLKDRYCHRVELEKDSYFYNVVGKRVIDVNSYHHQTVLESHYFNVVGRSDDGLIEVIESINGKQIGVQWHPERMLDYDESAFKILKNFIVK